MAKIACPVCKGKDAECLACKGSGFLNPPKVNKSIMDKDGKRERAAKVLRKTGYTIREIASILGYKSPQSIAHLLSKK